VLIVEERHALGLACVWTAARRARASTGKTNQQPHDVRSNQQRDLRREKSREPVGQRISTGRCGNRFALLTG
jgi:hypothetical protein